MAKQIDPYDIIGKKFNDLKVMAYGHYVNKKHFYICRCECEQLTLVRRDSLLTGNTKSCGCKKSLSGRWLGKMELHGLSRQPGRPNVYYKLWENIRNRCYNPKYEGYKYYGGRGIYVQDSWCDKGGFVKFYKYIMEELGPKPDGYWIDRIDNEGPYCEGNLRWVTPQQSNQNKRNTNG